MVVLPDGLHAVKQGERKYRVIGLVLFAEPETSPSHVVDSDFDILVKALVGTADDGFRDGSHLNDDLLALVKVKMDIVKEGEEYLIIL